MKCRGVVFDLDGTLLNTLPDITGVINSVTGSIGMSPRSESQIRQAVGAGVEELLRRLGVPESRNKLLAEQVEAMYARIPDSQATVYPGVREMILAVADSGIQVFILSNKPLTGLYKSVRDHLSDLPFSAVAGSELGKPAKPSSGTLLEMLGSAGISAGEALVVGDGEADVKVAEAAGTGHMAVLWGYRSRDALAAAGAVDFAETPEEVIEFINTWT